MTRDTSATRLAAAVVVAGATCNFPFTGSTEITESATTSVSSQDFYECTIANSERPWCFTTRPGKWGYCDVNGYNPLGLEWSIGNWSRCSLPCGSGIKTRPIKVPFALEPTRLTTARRAARVPCDTGAA